VKTVETKPTLAVR